VSILSRKGQAGSESRKHVAGCNYCDEVIDRGKGLCFLLPEFVAGFLMLVELCKGLLVDL
jgi:hypothetical protein